MTTINYPNTSMVEQVYKSAEKSPEAVAYQFQGKKTTYGKFIDKIEKTARSFMAAGIGEGDRVTICMPNTPQAVDSFYALNRIGAVPVMIHPLSAPAEIAFFVRNSSSKVIITLDMFCEKVEKALSREEKQVKIIVASIKDELPAPVNMIYPLTVKNKFKKPHNSERVMKWSRFMKSGSGAVSLPEKLPKYDDVAVILFSGGTTGTTKGILLTNLNMNALALQTGTAARFSLDGLRMLSVMPLFHNAKVQIREGYGTTECVTASCLTPYSEYKEGSIGVPFPDTYYKIVVPNTNVPVATGEEGEICISGPTVMKGYLDAPEETADALKAHGDGRIWLHTGDLGVMDEDGFIYFKQRIKRLIIVSGYNVYPSQVENAIDSHPDVLYSCAIGVSDIYKMHKVKAFVVLRPGVEPCERIKEEILHNCRERVSQYAVPYEIEFRPELPKTLVGKVAYRELEKEVNGEIA